jgi:HSP20 family protein
MTNLTRYTPFGTFGSLRREMDRLFDQLNEEGPAGASAVWAPRTDVSETEEAYVLHMDLPGLSKDALKIELHDGVLAISGERTSEHIEEGTKLHRVERTYGHFYRTFRLPQSGDPAKVKASLKEGVLTVDVPKREESKPRKIEIG